MAIAEDFISTSKNKATSRAGVCVCVCVCVYMGYSIVYTEEIMIVSPYHEYKTIYSFTAIQRADHTRHCIILFSNGR